MRPCISDDKRVAECAAGLSCEYACLMKNSSIENWTDLCCAGATLFPRIVRVFVCVCVEKSYVATFLQLDANSHLCVQIPSVILARSIYQSNSDKSYKPTNVTKSFYRCVLCAFMTSPFSISLSAFLSNSHVDANGVYYRVLCCYTLWN